MERVLWPMEPVEPRIANFFTEAIFADLRLLAREASFKRCEAFANVDGEIKLLGEASDELLTSLIAMQNHPFKVLVPQLHLFAQTVMGKLHLAAQGIDGNFNGFQFRDEKILDDFAKRLDHVFRRDHRRAII